MCRAQLVESYALLAPAISSATVPHEVHHKFLLPHEWFAIMYAEYRTEFDTLILGGSADTPARFWHAVRNSTEFQAHPVSQQTGLDMCVPLGLHGDGVPCTGVSRSWAQGVDVWSVTSLLARGPTLQYLTAITFLWQQAQCEGTVDELMLILAWSFYWLQKGQWPTMDPHKKARCAYALYGIAMRALLRIIMGRASVI